MYCKITVVTVILAVAAARPQDHGHEHGHAYSSQSIVLHQSHGQAQGDNNHGHERHEHYQPGHIESHDSHHHGVSSQHIQRHDVPGKAPEGHHDYYAHPKYEFEYSVQDPHTHDIKSQHESRDGDVVKGYYSLHEADGTVRIVHYSSDKKSGFNANVERKGHVEHIVSRHHY